MHDYAWFGPIFSILRFCHERGQIKRWRAVRHVKRSGISMRVFSILILSQKKSVFRPADVSCFFVAKHVFQKCSRSVWEVSGTIPDLFRPILDQFWTIVDQNRLKNYIRKIPITNPI